MATANEMEPTLKMQKTPIKSDGLECFAYDDETTDVVLVVEDKRLHLSWGVLMQASPVSRKMLASNGKEKQGEISLPDKSFEEFVLFLRCVCPLEYVKLNGDWRNEIVSIFSTSSLAKGDDPLHYSFLFFGKNRGADRHPWLAKMYMYSPLTAIYVLVSQQPTSDFLVFVSMHNKEGIIDVVLPLAKENQVNTILQKCEDWLLTEIEFIVGEVIGHVKETQTKVEFFAKCLLYGTKNELESVQAGV